MGAGAVATINSPSPTCWTRPPFSEVGTACSQLRTTRHLRIANKAAYLNTRPSCRVEPTQRSLAMRILEAVGASSSSCGYNPLVTQPELDHCTKFEAHCDPSLRLEEPI